jgi:flagellin
MVNSIHSNIGALVSNNTLNKANKGAEESSAKLASGSRIKSAKDDASGLVIANALIKEADGSQVALRNTNDGISFAQVADGALNEATDILQRMRDLSIQASSGQVPAEGKAALDAEYASLSAEVARIGADTTFGGTQVFGGSADVVVDSAGASTINISPASIGAVGGTASAGGIAAVDSAIAAIATTRGELGAASSRLTSAANNLGTQIESASAAASRIRDTDYAEESSNRAKSLLEQRVGLAVRSQANASSSSVLSLLK